MVTWCQTNCFSLLRKEGNVLFNDTFNTFIHLHGVRLIVKDYLGKKEMFHLMMHSTHFIYGIGHMVKDH